MRALKAQKQFQQIFNIVDTSNILGKHVYSVKIRRNLIRGIVFCAKAASVTDFFEIFAYLQKVYLQRYVYKDIFAKMYISIKDIFANRYLQRYICKSYISKHMFAKAISAKIYLQTHICRHICKSHNSKYIFA